MERRPTSEGPDVCTCGHERDRHGLTTKPKHRDGPCQFPGVRLSKLRRGSAPARRAVRRPNSPTSRALQNQQRATHPSLTRSTRLTTIGTHVTIADSAINSGAKRTHRTPGRVVLVRGDANPLGQKPMC
jgi:hypothetical protein